MVQRIKVQSGQIVYESADSAYDINVNVRGSLDVATEVNIGATGSPGLISAVAGESLTIQADDTISLSANILELNGSIWPNGTGLADQVLVTDGAGNLSWGTGGASNPTVTLGINAAGSDYSTATPITSNFNEVSTAVTGGGVKLPSGSTGTTIFVFNQSVDDIYVYPDALSSQIDIYGLGLGYLLEAGYRVSFVSVSSSQWFTLNVPFIPEL
jgi:hypothetical protein